MLNHPLVRRLLSPSGFVLVGLCLFLPFITASCDIEDAGQRTSASATYSGWDLVVGGEPALAVESTNADVPAALQPLLDQNLEALDVQPFAIIAVLLILAGVAVAAVAHSWSRFLAGAAAAASAAVFLVGAELDLRGDLRVELRDRFGDFADRPPEAGELMIELSYGFWIAVILLVALLALNLIDLVQESRHAGAVGGPLPTMPAPPGTHVRVDPEEVARINMPDDPPPSGL